MGDDAISAAILAALRASASAPAQQVHVTAAPPVQYDPAALRRVLMGVQSPVLEFVNPTPLAASPA